MKGWCDVDRTRVELGDGAGLVVEVSRETGHVQYTLEVGRLTLSWTLDAATARRVANETLAAANGR